MVSAKRVLFLVLLMLCFATITSAPSSASDLTEALKLRDVAQVRRGPEITTPSGVTLKGNYHRHEFAYTAPPGDGDAGKEIYLKLLSEDFMNFYHVKDGKPGEPELWRRCEVIS